MTVNKPIREDRIVTDPLILAGKPTVKGTRISVELIMELLDGGRSEAAGVYVAHYPLRISEPVGSMRQAVREVVQRDLRRSIDAIMDGKR